MASPLVSRNRINCR